MFKIRHKKLVTEFETDRSRGQLIKKFFIKEGAINGVDTLVGLVESSVRK